jgi:23S rRNA pseudouridine2605 synthase
MAHLGLTVNRIIRVAYGPFQLGNLAPGAVAEVPRKVIAEQIGLETAPRGVGRACARRRR